MTETTGFEGLAAATSMEGSELLIVFVDVEDVTTVAVMVVVDVIDVGGAVGVTGVVGVTDVLDMGGSKYVDGIGVFIMGEMAVTGVAGVVGVAGVTMVTGVTGRSLEKMVLDSGKSLSLDPWIVLST